MIRAVELTHAYDPGHGVFDLDFELQGGLVALLGENGAGKSTTFKLLMGLLRPTKGGVTILGRDLWEGANHHELKRHMGYLPSEEYLIEDLTGRENLEYCGYVRCGRTEAYRELAVEMTLLGAERILDTPFHTCSTGEKRKLQILASLLTRPRILIWDEPTESLDPASAAGLTELMRSYPRPGRLLLFSSHRLELVEELCTEAIVLKEGKIIARIPAPKRRELTALFARHRLPAPESAGGPSASDAPKRARAPSHAASDGAPKTHRGKRESAG